MHSQSPEKDNPRQSSPNSNFNKQGLEGRWTSHQHLQFLKGVIIHGKDWKKIDQIIATRTGSQVRSHAQKYFLKIAKINKQRRRHKNKAIQMTQTQQEILNMFTQADITQNTPQQISSIIRKQTTVSIHYSKDKINLEIYKNKEKQLKSSTKTKILKNLSFQNDNQKNIFDYSQWKVQNTFNDQFKELKGQDKTNFIIKNFINCKIEQEEDQDESYFIHLVKKNKDHFCNGGDFSDLIDFGKSVEAQETSPRKLSFSVVQTDEKMIQE